MPRLARVIVPDTPHHITQRGNRRQQTFFTDGDYRAFLRMAAEEFAKARVEVWSYCLMPNHVHLIVLPRDTRGLATAMHRIQLSYALRINSRQAWTGHFWQGRFASYPMDDDYLAACVRYVGLNPVRAGLVAHARDWPWSSARAHLHGAKDPLITPAPVWERFGPDLAAMFETPLDDETCEALRAAARTGRPLGARQWLAQLENTTGRKLAARPIGRPRGK